jgi:hypothetical protein
VKGLDLPEALTAACAAEEDRETIEPAAVVADAAGLRIARIGMADPRGEVMAMIIITILVPVGMVAPAIGEPLVTGASTIRSIARSTHTAMPTENRTG